MDGSEVAPAITNDNSVPPESRMRCLLAGGGHPCLVDEDEALRIEFELPVERQFALLVPFTGLLFKEPPYSGIWALLPFDIGTPNNAGSVLTASGLVFIAAATDDLIRTIDIETGEVLWEDALPAGGQATPITYSFDGRQYLVILAGGHHSWKPRSATSSGPVRCPKPWRARPIKEAACFPRLNQSAARCVQVLPSSITAAVPG